MTLYGLIAALVASRGKKPRNTSVQKSPRRNAWETEYLKPSQGWHGGPHGMNLSSHGDLSQGWLAMRLTVCRNRWLRSALLAAWVIACGCQRLPYIDQIQAGRS